MHHHVQPVINVFICVLVCVCLSLCVLPACMCLQKPVKMLVSCCVGAGNQTWVLYKSCLMFLALEPSFLPATAHFFNEQGDLGVQSEKMHWCSCCGVVPGFWVSYCPPKHHFKRTGGSDPRGRLVHQAVFPK